MSGVIDEQGQWERCNGCGKFVLIQSLYYEKPSETWKHGRDLCGDCMKVTIDVTANQLAWLINGVEVEMDANRSHQKTYDPSDKEGVTLDDLKKAYDELDVLDKHLKEVMNKQ